MLLVVGEVRIFSTVLRSGDNREIIVPNGHIYSGPIENHSARETRRIGLVTGIGFGDEISRARELIEEAFAAGERVLPAPAPAVAPGKLADGSVNLIVRPRVKTAGCRAVRPDLPENLKRAFDGSGSSIPYPQRDVHVHNAA